MEASIDIGSNSILLLVQDGKGNTIHDIANVTGLGKGIDQTGSFNPSSMSSSLVAFKEYLDIINKYKINPSDVIVTATEASRVANNASSFFSQIKSQFGFSVNIISGEGEAYYTALGVCGNLSGEEEAVILDIGGASTELIKVSTAPFRINNSVSLKVGSVRMTDWRKSRTDQENVDKAFSTLDVGLFNTPKLLCTAGTMTTIASMLLKQESFQAGDINKFEISSERLKLFYQEIKDFPLEELQGLYPTVGKRAENIVGGLVTAIEVIERLDVLNLSFSTFGLRYGTLKEGKIDERYKV